ncbi:hypothetical protein M3J09_012259 [Ascochyta lentis]
MQTLKRLLDDIRTAAFVSLGGCNSTDDVCRWINVARALPGASKRFNRCRSR